MQMPHPFETRRLKFYSRSFWLFFQPALDAISKILPLESRGDRPLKMTFEDQLKMLVFFHLEEHVSARHMLQVLEEDDFARQNIAPEDGIKKSSFFEAINNRGIKQLQAVFNELCLQSSQILPNTHPELGNLVALDGSLIDATLSMQWADYRKGAKKAKVHLGFDLNHGIPSKIYFTDGKGAERPFVDPITAPDQTVVSDRGYQEHDLFDKLQTQNKHFVIRIKGNTTKTIVKKNSLPAKSIVFYDAEVLLGSTENKNQSKQSVRLVGYRVAGINYWIATDRRDLRAEQIAEVYKLRWKIENFFSWWKRHLRVYHLIARSRYGLMVQILAGLITYLLLAIYCHKNHGKPVTIKRVRELRIKIQNELRIAEASANSQICKNHETQQLHAKT
jgi:hypothetical protein